MSKNEGVPSNRGKPGQAMASLRARARWSAQARAASRATCAAASTADGAGLDEALASAEAGSPELALRLVRRLAPLVERGVPARAVEAGPAARSARLRFADGTTVVVKGLVAGDVAVLATAMTRWSVRPVAWANAPEDVTHLLLTWPGRRHGLWLRVAGLDQPD